MDSSWGWIRGCNQLGGGEYSGGIGIGDLFEGAEVRVELEDEMLRCACFDFRLRVCIGIEKALANRKKMYDLPHSRCFADYKKANMIRF